MQSFRHWCSHAIDLLKHRHAQFVCVGLLVGAYYFPTWIRVLLLSVPKGSANFFVNSAMLAIAGWQLWEDRQRLSNTKVVPEERQIGQMLILAGITSFLVYHGSVMAQTLNCALIFVGIAASCWGFQFFRTHWLVVLLVIPSLHPNLERVSRSIWDGFTPPYTLAKWMAWGGGLILQAIGQPVTVDRQFLILPTNVIEVAQGCDGMSMAFSVGAMGLLVGAWFKSRWQMIVLLVTLGAGLALVFNFPRIALMTFAATYWGKAAFEFWHGPIGGQIFSGVLLTIYYYLSMFILERHAQFKQPQKGL